jgi:hypothetical protein
LGKEAIMKNEKVIKRGRFGLRRSKYCFNEERGPNDFPLSKAAAKAAGYTPYRAKKEQP